MLVRLEVLGWRDVPLVRREVAAGNEDRRQVMTSIRIQPTQLSSKFLAHFVGILPDGDSMFYYAEDGYGNFRRITGDKYYVLAKRRPDKLVTSTAHGWYFKNEAGDIDDIVYFCSDGCHRQWCVDTDCKYEGWNGGLELPFTEECATCFTTMEPPAENV